MNQKELQDRLATLTKQSEDIRLKYAGKSANMTGQEETEWTRILDEADSVKTQLANLGRDDALKSFASRTDNALDMGDGGQAVDDKGVPITVAAKSDISRERQIFRNYLKLGSKMSGTEIDEYSRICVETAIKSFSGLTPVEREKAIKAYQGDNPAGGGYLITPQELAQELITLMKDLTFIRARAKLFTMPVADTLGVPAIDTDPSDADWTSELAVGNEETTMAFGKRELRPQALAKYIKESNKLLRQIPNVEELVMDRLAYKFAITEEKAFLSGSGANQPLGVFTLSGDGAGIDSSRDVTAANAASIVADDLINVTFQLKAQYRQNAEWIMNRSVIKVVRKLKDGNNNYIWATALGPGTGFQGMPATLLDRPVNESEYAPGTITTGLYTAILGDFSRYYIVDALNMQMQVVDQLFALTNQTGYILRREMDGMPVLAEAFARLKQA